METSVKSYGYDAPFVPMVVLLLVSALLWFKVDPTRGVIAVAELGSES